MYCWYSSKHIPSKAPQHPGSANLDAELKTRGARMVPKLPRCKKEETLNPKP